MGFLPFKRQPHKIVKHTQTIRRLQPKNYLSAFDHFMGSELKVLKYFLDKTILKPSSLKLACASSLKSKTDIHNAYF